jgi:hypothetical protein
MKISLPSVDMGILLLNGHESGPLTCKRCTSERLVAQSGNDPMSKVDRYAPGKAHNTFAQRHDGLVQAYDLAGSGGLYHWFESAKVKEQRSYMLYASNPLPRYFLSGRSISWYCDVSVQPRGPRSLTIKFGM